MGALLFNIHTWVQVRLNTVKLTLTDYQKLNVRIRVRVWNGTAIPLLTDSQNILRHLPRSTKIVLYFNAVEVERNIPIRFVACSYVCKNEDVLEAETGGM